MGYADVILADSPVAYWRTSESPGATTATDSSGNGRNATYVGGYTLGAAGAIASEVNGAVSLNGSSGYLNAGDDDAFDGMAALSVEAWIRPSNPTAAYGMVLAKTPADYSTAYELRFYIATGRLEFILSGSVVTPDAIGATVLVADQWYHVVGTYNGTTANLYLNGVLDGTDTKAADAVRALAEPLAIGCRRISVTPELFFSGRIDEVAIYSAALSAAQVRRHYHAAKTLGFSNRLLRGRLVGSA